tara:strand:+ start:135 stop:455 length:321 start_codon:yes stop_codon:yes gene_type:complete
MNYEERIETLENQISFLLQEYNILANKMNEYTAAFKIIENSMPDLKERANKLEKYWNNTDQYYKNVEDKHIKMVQDLTQGMNVIMQAQIKLKKQVDNLEKNDGKIS